MLCLSVGQVKALHVVAVGTIASQTHWMPAAVETAQEEERRISLLFHL
jgi:hypothetical protein